MNHKVTIVFAMVLPLLFSACDDSINKEAVWAYGKISGKVEYHGSRDVDQVRVVLLKVGDAQPVSTLYLPPQPDGPVQFPVAFAFEGLRAGSYQLNIEGYQGNEVLLRTEGSDPVAVTVEKPQGQTTVVLLEVAQDLDVVAQDDLLLVDTADATQEVAAPEVLTPADVVVTPKSGKSALYGTVAWDGQPATGKLTIAGFAANPPAGPPTLIKYVADPVFPQFFSIDNVTPGTHYVIVYLDTVSGDGMQNNPESDPASVGFRQVTLGEGESSLQDFWLQPPAGAR